MSKDKEILLKWAATYGENWEDVRASHYDWSLMIEFAKFYQEKSKKRKVLIMGAPPKIDTAIVAEMEKSVRTEMTHIAAARERNLCSAIKQIKESGSTVEELSKAFENLTINLSKLNKPNLEPTGSKYHK